MSPRHRPAVDRFAEKAALADSGCIEWIAARNPHGYGVFHLSRAENGKISQVFAHRWSYEYHVGPVPEGLQLDHLCRNRACVNPDHLEPVTARENTLRGEGLAAICARKTHCPQGHPYEGANLYVHPATGQRHCRACRREHLRNQKAS